MRKNPLALCEKVFDIDTRYWGHIVSIKEGVIELVMTDADIWENEKMFDCELEESEYMWNTTHEESLYQIAEGIVGRDGNIVCFEHNDIGEGYPYYSPYLDENLYTFEVFSDKKKKLVIEFEIDSVVADNYSAEQIHRQIIADVREDGYLPEWCQYKNAEIVE